MTNGELRRFLAAVKAKHTREQILARAWALADALTKDMGAEAEASRQQLYEILMRGAV